RAKRIDGRLVSSLMALPIAITGESAVAEFHSPAVRALERGQGVGLPSGGSIAGGMGGAVLTRDEGGVTGTGWRGETPLWYYILREADVRGDGDRLGPVGGRIVGEVLIGVLQADPQSVLYAPKEWESGTRLSGLLSGIDR